MKARKVWAIAGEKAEDTGDVAAPKTGLRESGWLGPFFPSITLFVRERRMKRAFN